ASLDQGGLGLPDRDYYTTDDDKSKETREHYVQYVRRIFTLLGDSPEAAATHATTVMRMETDLAKASLTRVERRDPYNLKHKMTVAQLQELAPSFHWHEYFKTAHAPSFEIANVAAPLFFKEFDRQLQQTPLEDWKQYL